MEPGDLDDRTYTLLFGIRRSVLYHGHRRRFYEIWNSLTVFMASIGGSAAVAAFISASPNVNVYAVVPSVIVAVVSALDMAVGTARRANLHTLLAQQFIMLEKRFPASANLKDDEYAEIKAARLDIESSEPTALRLLDVVCDDQLFMSMGGQAKFRIPWYRRWLAHWFSQVGYIQKHISPRLCGGAGT